MGRSGGVSKTQPKPTTAQSLQQKFDTKIDKKLCEMHSAVHTVADRKRKNDAALHNVHSMHEKTSHVNDESQMTSGMKSKLRTAYGKAIGQAEEEADHLHTCLQRIAECRKLRTEKRIAVREFHQSEAASSDSPSHSRSAPKPMRRGALMVMLQATANTLPLWVGEMHETPPPLCGALPQTDTHECQVGDACAALVLNKEAEDSEDEHCWILGEVAENGVQGKYRVDDVDEEQHEVHLLPRKRVVALPQYRANFATDPSALFPIDAVVLALYPQTTCFYKGVVEQVPSAPTDDYLVAFADKSFATGYSPPLPVPQRYVIGHTEPK